MLLKICREKLKPLAEYRMTFYSWEMADAGNFGGSVPEYKHSSAIIASFIFLSRIREAFYVTERTSFHAGS
ncbi:hypothetical protein YQ41_000166 [Salmonella enterica subsp. salamae]|nr:hypothetical protein [Salmonella enterica subsp. salamae]EDW3861220.1 hypothetical protein [Salmonella enterica subsp. salamae]